VNIDEHITRMANLDWLNTMKTRYEIFEILSRHLPEMRNEYGVEKLGIFGSVVKNSQTTTSDIDILVEFSRAIGMVKFLQLENNLQELLGAKVDLVTRKALKKHIGKQILQEIVFVN
jgi:predicted nucleotidyltransferase